MGGSPYNSAKEGVGTLQVFLLLTMKEHHVANVYDDSMASKQIIGHLSYNGAANGFKVKS